jgi:predicted TPR repeat methyltransferase
MTSHASGDLNADRRYGYALGLMEDSDYAAAADLLRQTIDIVPAWIPAWFALGEAEEKNGNRAESIAAFQKALTLDPTDTLGAGVRLARLGAIPASGAMTGSFVASLFDQYTGRFDDHLVKALDYRGPEIIVAALTECCATLKRAFHFDSALDIGCGTGLMAKAIWQQVDSMSGIDLSPLMVQKALESGLYHADHLHVGDSVAYLKGLNGQQFDLLMAADVLVYVGDLAPLFTGAFKAMTPDGLLAFTVQSCDGDSFRIGDDLRYHHSERYLRTVAEQAGLRMRLLEPCTTRLDGGKPVAGFVVVMDRHDADHPP